MRLREPTTSIETLVKVMFRYMQFQNKNDKLSSKMLFVASYHSFIATHIPFFLFMFIRCKSSPNEYRLNGHTESRKKKDLNEFTGNTSCCITTYCSCLYNNGLKKSF